MSMRETLKKWELMQEKSIWWLNIEYIKMKVSVSLSFALILIALVLPKGYGQNIKNKNISLEEGLSQSSVLSIFKDRQGFMWFGTRDGLNKYDGYSFTVYKNNPKDSLSLYSNHVQCISDDKEGNLWVGTWGGGLSVYNKKEKTFKVFKHSPENTNSLSNNYVNFICQDKKGEIWAATRNGLNRYDSKAKTFKVFKNDPQNPNSISSNDISYLLCDRLGILWIATWGGGLNRYNPETGAFTTFKRDRSNPGSLRHNIIKSIFEDKEGRIWIGTWGGLSLYNPSTQSFTNYKYESTSPSNSNHNLISAITQDNNGTIWVGTWGEGLNTFDSKAGKFHRVHQESHSPSKLEIISSIYSDKEGNIWVGTLNSGVNLFNTQVLPFATFQNVNSDTSDRQHLSNDDIRAIYKDKKGIIWIGAEDGLNRFNSDSSTFSVYKKDDVFESEEGNFAKTGRLSSNSIRSLYEDSKGNFWVGTSTGGLNLFDREKESSVVFSKENDKTNILSSNNIRSIYEGRKNNLWIGTSGGGLYLFDREKGFYKSFKNNPSNHTSLSDDFITFIYERRGAIWIGTQNGLNIYEGEKGFKVFRNSPEDTLSISSSTIYCMYEDKKGITWIGTQRGLNKLRNDENTFISYSIKDGLPGEEVFGIVEDKNNKLWLSTNKGLSRFDPKAVTFQNFDIRDGLQGNIFNPGAFAKGDDEKIYFGGISGFNVFHPDSIKANTFKPTTVITTFKILNKPETSDLNIYNGEPIKLSFNDAFFSIEFASLSYLLPEKNQYKYKLEGFDKDWINAGTRREVTYTNLEGGDYTFLVLGSNNHGVWSTAPASLKITVIPPWWKTVMFKILASVFIAILIVSFFHLKTYRIKVKNRLLEARVIERTHKIEQQKREIEINHQNLNQLNSEISHKNEELEKKVEERTRELKASEHQLRLITDALPVLVSYIDKEHKFRFNNKTYEEWFKVKSESINGLFIRDVIGEQAYNKVKVHIEKALNGEFVHFQEEVFYSEAGRRFISGYYVPHFEGGTLLGFYAMITDISERKKIEEALAKALSEYENKNIELLRINTDLDNFVYTASHDLRSPISNLEGLLQLMIKKLENRLDTGEEEIFAMMSKSILRLKRTVGELGEIAKVQKEFLPGEELSFIDVVQEVKEDMASLIEESKAKIEEDFEVVPINYPHKHLRSILYNLISNAIKYRSDDRCPLIKVTTRKFGE